MFLQTFLSKLEKHYCKQCLTELSVYSSVFSSGVFYCVNFLKIQLLYQHDLMGLGNRSFIILSYFHLQMKFFSKFQKKASLLSILIFKNTPYVVFSSA